MNVFDYILIFVISACIYSAVRYIIRQKKKGGCIGCGECCKCSGCSDCKLYKDAK